MVLSFIGLLSLFFRGPVAIIHFLFTFAVRDPWECFEKLLFWPFSLAPQPNSPTDDPEDIFMQVLDGWAVSQSAYFACCIRFAGSKFCAGIVLCFLQAGVLFVFLV
jgi:hypothetical protein